MVQIFQADDRTRTDNLLITNQLLCQLSHIGTLPFTLSSARLRQALRALHDSNGNRTRVTAVKGRCLNRLTMEPHFLFSRGLLRDSRKFRSSHNEKTPRVGLEPTTARLTAACSTD